MSVSKNCMEGHKTREIPLSQSLWPFDNREFEWGHSFLLQIEDLTSAFL